MRIGIDCRLSGAQHAGIGRYIQNLVTRLPQLDSQITWVLFVTHPQQLSQLQSLSNVEIITTPIRHYSVSEQWSMWRAFSQAHLDLLHVPHFNVPLLYSGKLVITIHDLLWHEYRGSQVTTLPTSWYWIKYLAYRLVSTHAIHQARQILVPTQTIAQTLRAYYPAAQTKIVVTKEGIDQGFFRPTSSAPTPNLPSNRKTLLYIGSLYPHKNVALIINALPQLPDYQLAIVGARNVFQKQTQDLVKKVHVEDQVRFLGYMPDESVAGLMRQATALVQPSLSEGFGLTGLEAMAVGVPVLASDIPVFREIYQTAAEYFDPHDPSSFVSAVSRLTAERRSHLITTGQKIAQTFSWDEMTQQTLTTYRRALKITS